MPLEDEVVKRHVLEMTVLRVSPVAQREVLTAAGLVNAHSALPADFVETSSHGWGRTLVSPH